ncbi:class I (E and Q) tRNA synthetase, partial [Helicosporidium sp. ATCC 50920]
LVARGMAYPCFCSDEELARDRELALSQGRPPVYAGRWATADRGEVAEKLERGEPHVVRFRVGAERAVDIRDAVRGAVRWRTEAVGDFVILRSSGLPVYNFSAVVDDALMGISHVLRGEEHLSNTLRQELLYQALGFAPPRWAHLPLILGADRAKLSKRAGAASLADWRAQGMLPSALRNHLALLGWNDGTERELFLDSLELARAFSLERVSKAPAIFDPAKLRWINGQHLAGMPRTELESLIVRRWMENGLLCEAWEGEQPGANQQGQEPPAPRSPILSPFHLQAVHLVRKGLDLLPEADDALLGALGYPLEQTLAALEADGHAREPLVEKGAFLPVAQAVVDGLADEQAPLSQAIHQGSYKAWTQELGKKLGRKGKALFLPLRLALTGCLQGPEVAEILKLLALESGEIRDRSCLATLAQRRQRLKAWVDARL